MHRALPCGFQHPAYVTLNVWPAPAPPALSAGEYPVGLLLELCRLLNPDAMAGGGAGWAQKCHSRERDLTTEFERGFFRHLACTGTLCRRKRSGHPTYSRCVATSSWPRQQNERPEI